MDIPEEEKTTPAADDDSYTVEDDTIIPVGDDDNKKEYSFISHGCVADSQAERIMERKTESEDANEQKMTNEVCCACVALCCVA